MKYITYVMLLRRIITILGILVIAGLVYLAGSMFTKVLLDLIK